MHTRFNEFSEDYSVPVDRAAYAHAPRARRGAATAWVLAGVALAASAVYVQRRKRQAERACPPLGRFVEVDGVRLHYVERGEGQPLVLLHGNGSLVQDFLVSGLVDEAARKYRVIAFDRPGYGYSSRPRTTIWTPRAQAALLHKAMRALDVEQPIVLGHSWGALVAAALGLDFPDDIKSLVLASGYYYPTVRADVPLLAPPSIPIIGDVMRYTVSPLLGRAAWPAVKRRLFGPAPVPEHFEQGFPTWMMLRPSQMRASAAEAALMIPAAYTLRPRYHELLMPVVILAGDSDRHVDTYTQSQRLHEELPHSRFHTVAGAGHMVHQVALEPVLAAIDEAATASGAIPASVAVPVASTSELRH